MSSKSNSNHLLSQGAEAKIFLSNGFIIKDRIPKSYRIKELDDKIRKQRTKSEAKLLEKASKIINSPKPFFTPDFYQIKMPYIKGKKLSEHLDNFPLEKQKEILKTIGEETAKLHDNNIIHGDLTTSNMILVEERSDNEENNDGYDLFADKRVSKRGDNMDLDNKPTKKRGDKNPQGWVGGISSPFQIFFIDFGLGFISIKAEDKAVDIHLLKQALEAKHFMHWEILFNEFLKGYKTSKQAEKVLERLEIVEKRGRYRH